MARYREAQVGVIDTANGDAAVLPHSPGWYAYQVWLAAGNVTDPYVAPTHVLTPQEQADLDEQNARQAVVAALRADAAIQALRNRTPAQVDSWIDANVNSLADARAVLKILARILALLARERIGT